jgi:hypothetical protein
VDFDGDRDGVEGENKKCTLPEYEGHGCEREPDPEEAPQAATRHHDAATAMGVGVHAVPMHQVFDGRSLRASHWQILLDFGFDLLSGSHGEDGTLQQTACWWRRGEKQVNSHMQVACRHVPGAHVSLQASSLFYSMGWIGCILRRLGPFSRIFVFGHHSCQKHCLLLLGPPGLALWGWVRWNLWRLAGLAEGPFP